MRLLRAEEHYPPYDGKVFWEQVLAKREIFQMDHLSITMSHEVKEGNRLGKVIVALESTVLTHGLPRPQNLQLARDMEKAVRENGATPATVGFLDGCLHVGLSDAELERLANEEN